MDYYVDMTATATGFVNWANVAPYEPERRERQRGLQVPAQTPISGATDFFDPVKGPSAPTTKLSRSPKTKLATSIPDGRESKSVGVAKIPVTEASEIDRIAKQRVRLMAAKYASGAETAEMVARLEILNQRLLDRSPRISVQQVQALESAEVQVTQARVAREERMRRLGIQG